MRSRPIPVSPLASLLLWTLLLLLLSLPHRGAAEAEKEGSDDDDGGFNTGLGENDKSSNDACRYKVWYLEACEQDSHVQVVHLILSRGGSTCQVAKHLTKVCKPSEENSRPVSPDKVMFKGLLASRDHSLAALREAIKLADKADLPDVLVGLDYDSDEGAAPGGGGSHRAAAEKILLQELAQYDRAKAGAGAARGKASAVVTKSTAAALSLGRKELLRRLVERKEERRLASAPNDDNRTEEEDAKRGLLEQLLRDHAKDLEEEDEKEEEEVPERSLEAGNVRSTNVSSAETGEEEGILSKMVGIFRSDDGSSERGTSTTKDPGKVKMEKEMAKVAQNLRKIPVGDGRPMTLGGLLSVAPVTPRVLLSRWPPTGRRRHPTTPPRTPMTPVMMRGKTERTSSTGASSRRTSKGARSSTQAISKKLVSKGFGKAADEREKGRKIQEVEASERRQQIEQRLAEANKKRQMEMRKMKEKDRSTSKSEEEEEEEEELDREEKEIERKERKLERLLRENKELLKMQQERRSGRERKEENFGSATTATTTQKGVTLNSTTTPSKNNGGRKMAEKEAGDASGSGDSGKGDSASGRSSEKKKQKKKKEQSGGILNFFKRLFGFGSDEEEGEKVENQDAKDKKTVRSKAVKAEEEEDKDQSAEKYVSSEYEIKEEDLNLLAAEGGGGGGGESINRRTAGTLRMLKEKFKMRPENKKMLHVGGAWEEKESRDNNHDASKWSASGELKKGKEVQKETDFGHWGGRGAGRVSGGPWKKWSPAGWDGWEKNIGWKWGERKAKWGRPRGKWRGGGGGLGGGEWEGEEEGERTSFGSGEEGGWGRLAKWHQDKDDDDDGENFRDLVDLAKLQMLHGGRPTGLSGGNDSRIINWMTRNLPGGRQTIVVF